MSIRLRLASYYGALFAMILLLITLLSYTIHTRGAYTDLDRTLQVSVDHATAEASSTTGKPHLVQGQRDFSLALRLYSASGVLLEQTPGTDAFPAIDPRAILRAPSGPPYDGVTRLIPPIFVSSTTPDPGGAFGLRDSAGQRWRIYVLPFHSASLPSSGYIEAVTPLGQLDAEIQLFRLFLPSLAAIGLALALFGSWAIAGRALRPIALMVGTARTITLSHDLSARIETSPHQDELGQLSDTFNEMLASLQASTQAEQRFVADASHELRAPLTAIQGNLELLRRYRHMPESGREEALAEVTREANRLANLVADLLALARADAGVSLKQHLFDLDVVVLASFRQARLLSQGQTLTLDPFEPVQIIGDEDRFKQLILILLDNSLKYTPVTGQVTLGLARFETDCKITVCDSGVGISTEDLPHIFERFYRADPGRSRDPGGTGLGLPIARWIVEQHGGTITVESVPGQGTRVTVSLPLPNQTSCPLAEHRHNRHTTEAMQSDRSSSKGTHGNNVIMTLEA